MNKIQEDRTSNEHTFQNRCFGCGRANPGGLHLEFHLTEDHAMVCQAEVSQDFEGHPGYLHGGVIATLLDEAMSKSVHSRGVNAMTRRMEIDYLRPVPSGSALRIEGRVTRNEGRKHWSEARVLNSHGVVLAQGHGLFIEVPVRREAR